MAGSMMASLFAAAFDAVLSSAALSVTVSVLIVSIIILWYRVAYAPYNFFKKQGINGPAPSAFFGNSLQLKFATLQEWEKKYGKVCGCFIGALPTYLVSDLELLKQIMVKDFDHFMNRLPTYLQEGLNKALRPDSPPDLVGMEDELWRETRHIITPTFSSRKLKMMVPLIQSSCTALEEKMQNIALSGKSYNIGRLFGEFTMETILATAFGHKVELLRGEAGGDTLTTAAAEFFASVSFSGPTGLFTMMAVISHIPAFLYPLLRMMSQKNPTTKHFNILMLTAKALVQARRQMGSSAKEPKDFLQLMLEASTDNMETADDESASVEDSQKFSSSSSSTTKKSLTDDEVVSLATMFLLAGYETTSNTLAFTSYLLAINPDKQEKLCADIDAYFEENEEGSVVAASQSIQYLDWVIQESLRLYPPGAIASRYCKKTCTLGKLVIKEGALIIIPISTLHYSPEYWEDPELFLPERFHPDEKSKRDPLAHMPFGWGPRNCIGMRFALMEAKMALVSVLRRFKFEKAPDTEVPLKTRMGLTLTTANGIHLRVVARN